MIEYPVFPRASSAMEAAKQTKFDTKGSLGDKDAARSSNTRTVQRKRAIPHSTMKNDRNIIVTLIMLQLFFIVECVVITLIKWRHIPASIRALALLTSVTL